MSLVFSFLTYTKKLNSYIHEKSNEYIENALCTS